MIKSSSVTIKFCNLHRKNEISEFISEYKLVMKQFISIQWGQQQVNTLPDKAICSQINTWLSARMIQCAGKQASAIVRGTRQKQKRRQYIIDKLTKDGELKKANGLQKVYDEASISMPNLDKISVELDSRFIDMDWNNSSCFDGWITIGSVGRKRKILIPVKKTKHFNKLNIKGVIKKGIRLSDKEITFMFDIPEIKSTGNTILGIDIGMKDTLSCSNGQQIGKDKDGHTYQSICNKLVKKKKGSKSFERTQKHRTNFLHWCVNQIDWSGISVLQRENIKNLRKFKHNRRNMQSWNYAELFKILDGKACDAGVQIKKLSPVYTSQRCSKCGYTKKTNRKGKVFICGNCSNTMDADLNASLNLSLPLKEISFGRRCQHDNKTGFYWKVDSQEPIVPDVN